MPTKRASLNLSFGFCTTKTTQGYFGFTIENISPLHLQPGFPWVETEVPTTTTGYGGVLSGQAPPRGWQRRRQEVQSFLESGSTKARITLTLSRQHVLSRWSVRWWRLVTVYCDGLWGKCRNENYYCSHLVGRILSFHQWRRCGIHHWAKKKLSRRFEYSKSSSSA